MTEHCAIEARYVNHRNVQGRKVLQVILEIPIEATVEFFNKFGYPDPAEEKRVALALLSNVEVDVKREILDKAGKEKRAFTDLPYSQQAALLCKDERFYEFLSNIIGGDTFIDASNVADEFRKYLSINSRADLDDVNNTNARIEFRRIRDKFWAATKSYPEQRG